MNTCTLYISELIIIIIITRKKKKTMKKKTKEKERVTLLCLCLFPFQINSTELKYLHLCFHRRGSLLDRALSQNCTDQTDWWWISAVTFGGFESQPSRSWSFQKAFVVFLSIPWWMTGHDRLLFNSCLLIPPFFLPKSTYDTVTVTALSHDVTACQFFSVERETLLVFLV
jgi:hypothetical protein